MCFVKPEHRPTPYLIEYNKQYRAASLKCKISKKGKIGMPPQETLRGHIYGRSPVFYEVALGLGVSAGVGNVPSPPGAGVISAAASSAVMNVTVFSFM